MRFRDDTEAAMARVRAAARRASPHFASDPIWLGIPVPKTAPWSPLETERNLDRNERRRAVPKRERFQGGKPLLDHQGGSV